MDYIRIKSTSQRDNGQQTEKLGIRNEELGIDDVKELLRDWIKLYPNSFASDVDFKIYQLENGDIIVRLHEDLSSMAVALLALYLETTGQQSVAYITIDDTEVVLKQNIGKRAKVFCELGIRNEGLGIDRGKVQSQCQNSDSKIKFVFEDNYCLDYDFERKPQPVKDGGHQFEEPEFTLPEEYESVVVGETVKKKIDEVLEDEGLTPKKLMWYFICGVIGLAIGFLIVYFTGR